MRRLWRWLTRGDRCNVGLHRIVDLVPREKLDGLRSLWWCRWCDRTWIIRDYMDLLPSSTFEIETVEQRSAREAASAGIARGAMSA